MEAESYQFLVQGSEIEPYNVFFQKEQNNNIVAFCTCPAGKMNQYCKHRFRILNGFTDDIVSENIDDILLVSRWLPGSNIEKALQELELAEKEVEKAKKKVSQVKKIIAREMHGSDTSKLRKVIEK